MIVLVQHYNINTANIGIIFEINKHFYKKRTKDFVFSYKFRIFAIKIMMYEGDYGSKEEESNRYTW